MDVFAAVVTGPGAGAIATIQLCGDSAEALLQMVFKPTGPHPSAFETGRILLGHIVDGPDTIDQVTIGCEAPDQFAIHCHGNPMIVQAIMALLRNRGVQLLTADQLRTRTLTAEQPKASITVEAKLALATVKTFEGAKIITAQIDAGLSQLATQWQEQIELMSLADLAAQARQVLEDSRAARLIISGCCLVLIGPPNTGKSTLLNTLAGRDKAITADIEGTTRDWVSAVIHMPPLAATIIDTAGLGLAAAADSEIDQVAQAASLDMLQRADLVLLVLDNTQPAAQLTGDLLTRLADKMVLVVLNKTDLPAHLDPANLPAHLGPPVPVSAAQAIGLEDLIQAIHHRLGVTDLPPQTAVAFTNRQHALLKRLTATKTPADAVTIITDLLQGPL